MRRAGQADVTRNGDGRRRPEVAVGRNGGGGGDTKRALKTSERVALDIVHDIVVRGLRSGDRLPLEAAMVDHYQVSRASLREALRLLEVQGLIHLKRGPGGGPVVGAVEPAHLARMAALYFRLDAATYGDLLATQALLEPMCAALAATHPDRAEAMAPFVVDHGPGDEVGYRRSTTGFHAAVYRLAANPVITLLTQAITHMVTSHVVATMDPVELRPSILRDHVALARAIAAGHTERARRGMAAHFGAQHAYYRERWPERLGEVIEWR